jgi:hypothetical protein
MKLVFIYNANSGFTKGPINSLHKLISPKTYLCDLCRLTHSAFGIKNEWNEFLEKLPIEKVFLHKNEAAKKFSAKFQLPCICVEKDTVLKKIISAAELKNSNALEIQKKIEKNIIG